MACQMIFVAHGREKGTYRLPVMCQNMTLLVAAATQLISEDFLVGSLSSPFSRPANPKSSKPPCRFKRTVRLLPPRATINSDPSLQEFESHEYLVGI